MNFAMMRAKACQWLLPAAVALAFAGCAEAPRPAAGAAAAAQPASEGSGADLQRALDRALERRQWSDLRLDAECRTDAGFRSATIFGSGVGIWNRERQLVLPRARVLALLREIQAAGFTRLPESNREESTGKAMALELLCRVRLDLDGASRHVHQLSKGRPFPELQRLAGRILEAAEESGRSGPGASSLTDGLDKIARGELAPELLVLSVLRQGEGSASAQGWELVLEGGKAILQRHPAAEDEEPRAVRLAPGEVAELAGRLAAARLDELPANLWASDYTDLEVRVLDRRRSLQARQFAGMTPATHGEAQQRFDRLWEALDALNRRLSAGR
jgi:hypothetical protein